VADDDERDCPFCARIKAGEFDYDNRYTVAFQPLNPVTPGHFLTGGLAPPGAGGS